MIQTTYTTPSPVLASVLPKKSNAELFADASPHTDQALLGAAPLPLVAGGELPNPIIHYRLTGPEGAPVLLVLGGISADRRVLAGSGDSEPGWWQDVAGPQGADLALDYQLLSIDWLAGSGASSGPNNWPGRLEDFPAIGTRDQAQAILNLLDFLEIDQLHGAIGASYGGMVVLQLAALAPSRLRAALVLGATHRPEPMASARRLVQRQILALGRKQLFPPEYLAAARALGMTTYRSAAEFGQRFGDDSEPKSLGDYLAYNGQRFARHFCPEGYDRLLASIDDHRVNPADIGVPLTLVAFRDDQVSPPALVRELALACPRTQALLQVDTLFGHDGFLLERQHVANIVRQFTNHDCTGGSPS